jgi:hypothetical protein
MGTNATAFTSSSSEYSSNTLSHYGYTEPSRTISRSPSASSLETPVIKKFTPNCSNISDDGGEESSSSQSYSEILKISETDVKSKTSKNLLSTEKAAVVAMLTLKNNSSDDSDDSTVTSSGTANLFRHHDVEATMDGPYGNPIHASLSTVAV